jgi:hypothetical protein
MERIRQAHRRQGAGGIERIEARGWRMAGRRQRKEDSGRRTGMQVKR